MDDVSVQCTTYLIEFGDEAYLKAKVGRQYMVATISVLDCKVYFFVKICMCPSGHT